MTTFLRIVTQAFVTLVMTALLSSASAPKVPASAFTVLVFSETAGFRHNAQIARGKILMRQLARRASFRLVSSENSTIFRQQILDQIDVVVFLHTTGNVLNQNEENALRSFVEEGGGFVGIHSAADTEYQWPFYETLVGAWFDSHPSVQSATVVVEDANHASTRNLPASFQHTDEWYNFRTNPANDPSIDVLLSVDESTYSGGTMGANHPVCWARTIQAGRSWYTAMGHTLSTYDQPWFQRHLLGGLLYAAQLDG